MIKLLSIFLLFLLLFSSVNISISSNSLTPTINKVSNIKHTNTFFSNSTTNYDLEQSFKSLYFNPLIDVFLQKNTVTILILGDYENISSIDTIYTSSLLNATSKLTVTFYNIFKSFISLYNLNETKFRLHNADLSNINMIQSLNLIQNILNLVTGPLIIISLHSIILKNYELRKLSKILVSKNDLFIIPYDKYSINNIDEFYNNIFEINYLLITNEKDIFNYNKQKLSLYPLVPLESILNVPLMININFTLEDSLIATTIFGLGISTIFSYIPPNFIRFFISVFQTCSKKNIDNRGLLTYIPNFYKSVIYFQTSSPIFYISNPFQSIIYYGNNTNYIFENDKFKTNIFLMTNYNSKINNFGNKDYNITINRSSKISINLVNQSQFTEINCNLSIPSGINNFRINFNLNYSSIILAKEFTVNVKTPRGIIIVPENDLHFRSLINQLRKDNYAIVDERLSYEEQKGIADFWLVDSFQNYIENYQNITNYLNSGGNIITGLGIHDSISNWSKLRDRLNYSSIIMVNESRFLQSYDSIDKTIYNIELFKSLYGEPNSQYFFNTSSTEINLNYAINRGIFFSQTSNNNMNFSILDQYPLISRESLLIDLPYKRNSKIYIFSDLYLISDSFNDNYNSQIINILTEQLFKPIDQYTVSSHLFLNQLKIKINLDKNNLRSITNLKFAILLMKSNIKIKSYKLSKLNSTTLEVVIKFEKIIVGYADLTLKIESLPILHLKINQSSSTFDIISISLVLVFILVLFTIFEKRKKDEFISFKIFQRKKICNYCKGINSKSNITCIYCGKSMEYKKR